MSHEELFKFWISMFTYQLPALVVSLSAVILILVKWKQAPRAALWALLGFGLILFLGIIMPVVHTAIQFWMFQTEGHTSIVSRGLVMSIAGIIWTVLHAVSYVFLLIAIFAGRPTINPVNLQPLDPH